MSEEKTTEEKAFEIQQEKRKKFVEAVMTQLDKFENAPSETDIEKWKTEFGEILLLPIDDDEFYMYRPLMRKEYLDCKKHVAKMGQEAQAANALFDEDAVFQDKVLEYCVLWTSQENLVMKKAGTAELIFEQIMSNSNFINAQAAAQLVIKL
jgi:hypothetical protein